MTRAKPQTDPNFSPPASIEAEQSVIGAILLRPSVFDQVMDIISVQDFYRQSHRQIYQAMLDLYIRQEPIDFRLLVELLRERGQLEEVGGSGFLLGLSEHVGIAINADHYARIVRDKATLRRLIECSQEIAGACLSPQEDINELLDWTESRFFEVTDQQNTSQIMSVGDIGRDDLEKMEEVFYQDKETHGLHTGFQDLDRLTVGLHPGEETILAARPGMGKTSLALNISWNVGHKKKEPVVIFSLEMPREQLVRRMISSAAQIDGEKLRRCRLSPEEWSLRNEIQADLNEAPIFIDDKPAISALEIRAKCRRLKSRHGLSLVIIDYLQLMREPHKSRSRDEAVSQNAYSIKALAKELSVPILVCCQVNREIDKEKRKKYRLSDLRESGAVEQAADNIWFLWRDEGAVVADLTLGKQRNGPVGSLQLRYWPEFCRFDNFAAVDSAHWQD